MENTTRYQNYKDFFPFYLREHSKKSTRLLHYLGTLGYQVLFWSLLVTQNYIFLPLIFLMGYGPAWVGHFFYEKNKPVERPQIDAAAFYDSLTDEAIHQPLHLATA